MKRKVMKLLHSLAACGLIGGIGCYMIMLTTVTPDNPSAYADMRDIIAAISNYILLPSLTVVLVSGLLSMAVHQPYIHKGWVGIKALLGVVVFKGGLQLIGASGNQTALVARQVANGEARPDALLEMLGPEWGMLWLLMIISVVNVFLAIWRPRIIKSRKTEKAKSAQNPIIS